MLKGHATNNRSSPSPLSGLKQLLNLYQFIYKHQYRHPSRLTSEDPSSIHIPIFGPLLTFVQPGMAVLLPTRTRKSHPALSSWFSSHKSHKDLYSSLSPRWHLSLKTVGEIWLHVPLEPLIIALNSSFSTVIPPFNICVLAPHHHLHSIVDTWRMETCLTHSSPPAQGQHLPVSWQPVNRQTTLTTNTGQIWCCLLRPRNSLPTLADGSWLGSILEAALDKDSLLDQIWVRLLWALFLTRSRLWTSTSILAEFSLSKNPPTLMSAHPWHLIKLLISCLGCASPRPAFSKNHVSQFSKTHPALDVPS